jgi:hypothetical protein
VTISPFGRRARTSPAKKAVQLDRPGIETDLVDRLPQDVTDEETVVCIEGQSVNAVKVRPGNDGVALPMCVATAAAAETHDQRTECDGCEVRRLPSFGIATVHGPPSARAG